MQRLELLVGACLGLIHLHEHGASHNDVKQAQLLVRRDSTGRPFLAVADMGAISFYEQRDNPKITGEAARGNIGTHL
jgi:hypothetical protein